MKHLTLSVLIALTFSPYFSHAQWTPSASQRVPEIPDCTIGDIAVARANPYPHIRFCQAAADQINRMFPGAGHFYYVHEYGHILRGPSEAEADYFAAEELANITGGVYYINAILRQLYYRARQGEGPRAGYGTPTERAARIREAAKSANSNLTEDPQTLLLSE